MQNKLQRATTRENTIKLRDPKKLYEEMMALTNKGKNMAVCAP